MRTNCLIFFSEAVLTGISNGLSRGKKPEEMEKLVNLFLCLFIFVALNITMDLNLFCLYYKGKRSLESQYEAS